MAFQNSGGKYDGRYSNSGLKRPRGRRNAEYSYYQLRESNRPDARDAEGPWRARKTCELELRINEWADWPEENHAYCGEEYCAEAGVKRAFKLRNKGEAWRRQGARAIFQAKQEEDDQEEGWQCVTAKERKAKVIKRSKELAETFVYALYRKSRPKKLKQIFLSTFSFDNHDPSM